MNVTLCVRTGDGGTIVVLSGEVDVCTEAPLQQALLWIIRERGARLMLDVSGVWFIYCAGLRALLATVRTIIELTGTHEALVPERSTTARSVRFLKRTDRMRCAGRGVCPPSGRWRPRHSVVLHPNAHDGGPATWPGSR